MINGNQCCLSEDPLKLGIHKVTTVQFEGDKPTGKVLNFTEAKENNAGALSSEKGFYILYLHQKYR